MRACVHACMFSCVHLMDGNPPGSSIYGIFQAEILDRLPFPTPGNLTNPGIELTSPTLADRFYTTVLPEKPLA